jgi:hypothetical protein
MNRIKTWQAVLLAVVAITVAAVVICRSSGAGEKGAPMPAVYGGPAKSAAPPMPPASFSGAPPVSGSRP